MLSTFWPAQLGYTSGSSNYTSRTQLSCAPISSECHYLPSESPTQKPVYKLEVLLPLSVISHIPLIKSTYSMFLKSLKFTHISSAPPVTHCFNISHMSSPRMVFISGCDPSNPFSIWCSGISLGPKPDHVIVSNSNQDKI